MKCISCSQQFQISFPSQWVSETRLGAHRGHGAHLPTGLPISGPFHLLFLLLSPRPINKGPLAIGHSPNSMTSVRPSVLPPKNSHIPPTLSILSSWFFFFLRSTYQCLKQSYLFSCLPHFSCSPTRMPALFYYFPLHFQHLQPLAGTQKERRDRWRGGKKVQKVQVMS